MKKGTWNSKIQWLPPPTVLWGLWFAWKEFDGGEKNAINTEDSTMILDPPSPIARHFKWKMACTKRYGQMTSKVAWEISDKIVSSH